MLSDLMCLIAETHLHLSCLYKLSLQLFLMLAKIHQQVKPFIPFLCCRLDLFDGLSIFGFQMIDLIQTFFCLLEFLLRELQILHTVFQLSSKI